MSKTSLLELPKQMAKIDFAMLATRSADGTITARPMSTNGEVEYDGTSWLLANNDSRKVADIQADTNVTLTFTGAKGLPGPSPMFIAVEGKASMIEDRAVFTDHWSKDAKYYLLDGIDTPSIVLIQVTAPNIRYWDGEHQGKIMV